MPELPVQIYDVVQQLAQPDMKIVDKFGIDVLDIGREFNDKPPTGNQLPLPMALQHFIQNGLIR